MGRTVGWLLAIAIMAGCIGSGDQRNAALAAPPPATKSAGNGNGTIEGVVVDEETLPVSGAQVQVAGRGNDVRLDLTTNDLGRFTATGLAGGSYLVYVSRIGYRESAPKAVELPADERITISLTLAALPEYVPHYATKTYTVKFNEYVCVRTPNGLNCVLYGWNTANVTKTYDVAETEVGQLDAIVAELRWQAPVSVCPGSFRSDVYAPDQSGIDETNGGANSRHWVESNPFHWDNVPESIKSPTHLFIPREGDGPDSILGSERASLNDGTPLATSGKWKVQTWMYPEGSSWSSNPVDPACIYDTTVSVWTTLFFNGVPAATWSALPR